MLIRTASWDQNTAQYLTNALRNEVYEDILSGNSLRQYCYSTLYNSLKGFQASNGHLFGKF